MPENHYDHEQDEWDFYQRELEKEHKSCMFSLKMLLIVSILVVILTAVFGCGSKSYALLPEGVPMKQEGDRIFGVFPAFQSDRHYAQWFYLPGYGLINADEYRLRVILERKEP